METAKLKKFAQFARSSLMEQVSAKLKLVLAENSAARREKPQAVAEIEKQIFGVSGKYLPSWLSVCSVVKNSFPPDEDNVIPMLDGDWFTDDISGPSSLPTKTTLKRSASAEASARPRRPAP